VGEEVAAGPLGAVASGESSSLEGGAQMPPHPVLSSPPRNNRQEDLRDADDRCSTRQYKCEGGQVGRQTGYRPWQQECTPRWRLSQTFRGGR
jgi:hypothetical protein